MVWPHTPIGSSRRRSSQMPTGKRASMREGPLAALFRKTAEDTGQPAQPSSQAPGQQPAASPKASTAAKPPRTRPAETGQPAEAGQPAAVGQPPEAPEPERRIPSPQERLRHAFSADIPENVLQPPTGPV